MRLRMVVLGLILASFSSLPAQAQEYRKWDVGGSLGMLVTSKRDFGGSQAAGTNTDPGFTGNLEVGRYFTTHLKGEVGVMKTNARTYWDNPPVTANPGLTGYTSRRAHPTSVSGALTYQFFENVFAHPYVSVGISAATIYEETETYYYGTNNGPPFGTVVRTTRRYGETRPFFAAGYKSYFNERTYMKSELLIAIDQVGASHGTIRIGFGFDF